MRQLSNGHGAVTIEDGVAYGWRGGLAGSFPLPLSLADANLLCEYCLAGHPGDGSYRHDPYWLRLLTAAVAPDTLPATAPEESP